MNGPNLFNNFIIYWIKTDSVFFDRSFVDLGGYSGSRGVLSVRYHQLCYDEEYVRPRRLPVLCLALGVYYNRHPLWVDRRYVRGNLTFKNARIWSSVIEITQNIYINYFLIEKIRFITKRNDFMVTSNCLTWSLNCIYIISSYSAKININTFNFSYFVPYNVLYFKLSTPMYQHTCSCIR